MKTIKFLSMAALALVGAMMTSCSSDDDSIIEHTQQPANNGKVVTLTATIGFDSDATTRALAANGVKTFATGDQIAVIYKNTSGETVKAVSEEISSGAGTASGTFRVTLVAPDDNEPIRYIYPAAMAKATVATDATINDAGTVDFTKLNSQDGTLATLGSTLDLCTLDAGAEDWTSEALPTGKLTNKLAILAITLKDNATPTANDITDKITYMHFRVESGGDVYNYSVNLLAAADPIYVAIRPTSNADIFVSAENEQNSYSKTLRNKTYEAGNGYPVTWTMGSAG